MTGCTCGATVRWCGVARNCSPRDRGAVAVASGVGARADSASQARCSGSAPMRLAYGDGNGIVIVDTAGKKVRRLSRSPEDWSDGEPSWSPDAKRVAFARTSVSNPGGVDLYTVRASGGSPQGCSMAGSRRHGLHVVVRCSSPGRTATTFGPRSSIPKAGSERSGSRMRARGRPMAKSRSRAAVI